MRYAFLPALALAALVGFVRADFTFTTTRENGQPDPQHDRIDFFGLNTGNGTGTKALAEDLTIEAVTPTGQPDKVLLPRVAGTKLDFAGAGIADPYHSDFTFANLLGDPSGGARGSDNDPTAFSVVDVVTSPSRQFGPPFSTIEVVGANLNGGVDATAAANGGKGALLAVAVVPSGDNALFSVNIGGDMGPPVPDPSLVWIFALFTPALTRHRSSV